MRKDANTLIRSAKTLIKTPRIPLEYTEININVKVGVAKGESLYSDFSAWLDGAAFARTSGRIQRLSAQMK